MSPSSRAAEIELLPGAVRPEHAPESQDASRRAVGPAAEGVRAEPSRSVLKRPRSVLMDPEDRSCEAREDSLSESTQEYVLTEGSTYSGMDPVKLYRVVERIFRIHPSQPPLLAIVIPGRPTSWKRTDGGRRRHTPRAMRIAAQRIRIVARDVVPDGWSKRGRFALVVVSEFTGGLEELVELGDDHVGCTGDPDADNLEKLVADALQGLVWDNDRQIVDERAIKRYGQPVARTVVLVWRVRS